MKLQRLGGFAAIAGVCCFIIFLIMGVLIMGRPTADDLLHSEKMMAALSAKLAHVVVLFLSYIIGYIFTFVMFLALHERMQADAVHLTRIMLIAASASVVVAITGSIVIMIGGGLVIVPAQDVSAFRALWAMVFGLRMMGHHAYGWAFLLTGCTILKTRSFTRTLGWPFVFAGIVWILTTIVLELLRVSHLIIILSIAAVSSFAAQVWIGVALLKQPQSTVKEMAAKR